MNRNSALIWLPAIEKAGLPVPKTIIVPYNHHQCAGIFDGEPSGEFSRLCGAVMRAAQEIGFPVFIRSDLASAKHSGPGAYKIEADGQNQPIFETLEDNEMKFWMGEPPQAILVREFLNLKHSFTAFRGLPIAREFRLFADENKAHCWHHYWPAETIEGHRPSDPNWRTLLELEQQFPYELPEICSMAIHAAQACGGGEWSVDFCQDVHNKWWLLDMARAEDSFHWEDCPRVIK